MNKIFRIVWSQATQSWVVVSELTKAHKKQSSSNAQKSAVKFSGNFIKSSAVALALLSGHSAYAALNQAGTGSDNAVALGEAAKANQARAIAIGKGATISSGQDTIAIGTDTKVEGHTSIVIGKNAKTTNNAEGTVVIGRDAFSEGSGNGGRPNTVVGRGAYTAFGQNGEYRLNAATALGFQAGSGLRVDPNNNRKLIDNQTNADNNAEVLVKAGYGLDEKAPADTKTALQAGNVNDGLTFYRKNHINEATAVGAEARAIGDQSIAIGGQVVAGDGVVALGGNDTDALRGNKYQVVTDDAVNKTKVETIDDYNLAYTESTTTVAGQYKKLVGRDMPTKYKSTYGQSGSVVIGMEAHSTTALGTAIGTNSVVRMGAFGATAIGAGSTVQPNAEAAVAIGMGSVANGAYALAGGTASWAEYGDIALGYQAKASGKDGAIAMGRATNAQGDSSIMIGGANIESASKQTTTFEKAKPGEITKKTVTEKINGQNINREYTFAATDKTTGTVAEAYKELTGITMDTAALDFAKNKNGHASTSLGVHALSKGDLGTAIGASSRADAIGSVALGTGAHATKQNAVAIGTGSTTDLVGTRQLSVNYDSDGNIVSDNSDKIAYTFKWAGGTNTSEGDVVSFGSSGAERQLKNVAAGRVAEDSTDAINGSQLNSITKKIAAGFNTSGNVVSGSSGEFTSKKANKDSTTKDYETAIRSDDKIQLQVGNNLKLDRDETESEIEVTDDLDKTKKVKKKIRKADFAYSLNPVLTNLTSAEFKGTDAEPTTKLTNAGVTITPVTAGKSPVSLTQNGLDNGGNAITDVAGNLDGAKANTNAPTTNATAPNTTDKNGDKYINPNNAATVGDVLNAGWNLQGNTTAKDFVTAYDTVNFVDGDGTTVSVTTNTDGKTSTIKYSVNAGNGLQKDPTGNTISVKPADNSLEVTNKGVKVKAADNTLTTDANGLKVNTGTINPVDSGEKAGTVAINTNDTGKIATVDTVVNAVNNAAWNAIASKTNDGENGGTVKKQAVKAGDTVTFEADKNIKIAQADGKFTFSTKDNVEFKSVKVGEDKEGKKPVNLTTDKATDVSNNDPANKPTTALNVSSDGKPTQITGVGSVLNAEAVPTTPAGTATTGNGQPKLVNLGTGHNQTALGNNVLNAAATVRDLASMGWVVSSDKTTDATGEYKDVVKNSNEVKFVGKNAAKVSGKTDPTTGIRTITVDVEVPSVETAKITQNTDGSVTGPAGETLTKALKDAKDELAKLPKNADPAKVQAAKDKVDAAQKAIDNSPNSNKVATAQNVADMINNSGFTLKAGKTEGGNLTAPDLANGETINPGDTITMKAGKNMSVKHEKDGSITYATKDEVEFNTVKVGGDANTYVDDKGNPVTKKEDGSFEDAKGNKVDATKVSPVAPVTLKTEKASPANNNAEGNHPTTALNVSSDGKPTQITGVGSTLNVKPVDTNPNGTPTTDADKPNLVDLVGTKDAPVNKNAAATVGDLANMGWVVSTKDGNGYTDVVKNANQVDFKGTGLATVTGETKDGIRTITVNVDAQKTVEAAQNPVVYTDSEGNKVTKLGDNFYPVEEAKDAVKIGDNYYPAGTVLKDGKPVDSEGNEATALVPTDKKTVKASMNNGNNEAAPTVLSNVGSNLPTVDDVKKQAFEPNDSKNPLANKSNKAAPITALEAAELLDPTSNKFAGNNAATVSDVLNAGWNLQNNGEARDFVKPYDTVNFINGKGTVAVVETADDATSSTVKFDVDAGEITADKTKPGAVKGPNTTGKTPTELAKNLADAQKAVDDLAKDPSATEDAKQKAQDALKAAQDESALLNKVATAQNVADMINASGFTLKADKTEGDNLTAADLANGEMINPGDTITMKAGKNMSVKHEKDGSITYATKDDVSFNTVNVGDNTYVDENGKPVTKDGDKYKDAEGNPVDAAKVTKLSPVAMKAEKAKPATNNGNKAKDQPTTALNVSSSDGKPTQITGVGSTLNVKPVDTNPNGTATTGDARPNLVDLVGTDAAPVNKNAAATVGDLQNMGWVVSTKDGNGYKDVVKNANQVDFVGKNGITVTGKTKDGIRTITVETAQSPVVYTDKAGNKLVKAGDNFYPADSVVFGNEAYPAGSVVIGGKVYPKGTTPEQVTAGTATPATALTNGKKPADVIASMNNGDDKSANAPMQLGNVAQGAETIAPVDADGNKLVKANDGKYYPEGKVKADGSLEDGTTDADVKQPLKLANDGKWYPADQISAKGVPTDTAKAVTPPAKMDPAAGLVDFANSNPNNAATIGDLQNMGWIVGAPTNGYTDQVRNTNKVNFVGTGIATVTGETDANGVRTITVNVSNGLVDVAKNEADTATGAVTGPKKAAEDALKAAKAKLDELNNKPTATEEEKKAAQDAVNKAQSAVNNAPNLVATAQNVADMINKSGFNLKTSAAEGEKVNGTKDEGELINPGATVEMVAGKNMSVKQDKNGKVTYATKDDVEFNTVKIANPNGATYTDKNNNPLVKADDGKFYPADQVENGKVKDPAKATPVDADKVTTKAAPSVEFKAEKATPATNNTGKDKDGKTVEPTTALNISSDDGKPTQLKGVGSVLNTADVKTSTGDQRDTDGNITPAQAGTDKLVDLGTNPKKGDKPLSEETLNSAATVRDLANMGWVVSAKDNNYTNTVKNANKVEFKGGAGISVEGKTTTDGVREITISVKDGEVIKPNQFTAKVNGTDTPVTKVGDQYYNTADIDPKTGKPNTKANPVTPDAGTTPTNAGDGYVTGNKVATAIQKSGFVVGKQTEKLSAADFNDKDEKVNPDDELRFADGNNTKVKLATKESVDKDGNKVTTTTVKVDVTGLPVQYTDKNGTPVTKVGDKYFTVDDKGNPTATEVKPADLTTNMVNPAAAPNVIGAPTALGNVKSNLPSVNDADKNAKDVAGNPIAGKDNKSAPITATEAADLLNPKTADGKANPKFAGNNAATVSDVLNTGWNLQNNGEAKDFVKPYDTVNFVDGKGTKVVVETTPNGTTSNVKFDIDTGKITNNDDGSVQGPVTPEMQKALKDAEDAYNSLPPNAPEAVRKVAKQALDDAKNNIANVENKVATAQDVANAINKSGFTLTTSANGGEKISGTPEVINPGKKVEMVAGKNMTVKQESNGKVTYATASNVTFDSVQFGDKGPKITNKAGNINVSGPDGKTPTKITGVAPGEISATSKDAINGSQLHAVASNLNNKINKVGKHADAGTASALAAANIPQAYTPGKSLVGIAAGNYQGQNGLAVGMSRISDNGKIIIRLSGTANSQGKTGVAAGVGYQW